MITMHRSIQLTTFSLVLAAAPLLAQSTPQPPQPSTAPRIATTRVIRPTGWIGISYSATSTLEVRSGSVVYGTYPVVEAVVPGSPAHKAGIQVGDTLVAFNGRDFREDGVPFASLLRPGEKIAVRYKRGRRERRTTVTVGEPQGSYSYSFTPQPGVDRLRASSDELARQSELLRTQVERLPIIEYAQQVRAAAQAAVALEREFLMNPPATPMVAFAWPSGAMAIAGCEVVRMNEDLGSVLGVNRGVLIVSVAPGTAADNAGLKGGDVIVSSEAGDITTPADFQRAVARATQNKSLRLNIVRRGKAQNITIRL